MFRLRIARSSRFLHLTGRVLLTASLVLILQTSFVYGEDDEPYEEPTGKSIYLKAGDEQTLMPVRQDFSSDAKPIYFVRPGEIIHTSAASENRRQSDNSIHRFRLVEGLSGSAKPPASLFLEETSDTKNTVIDDDLNIDGYLETGFLGAATVYDHPGFSKLDCGAGTGVTCSEIKDPATPIKIVGSRLLYSEDPFSMVLPEGEAQERQFTNYYKIRYKDQKGKTVESWIPSQLISTIPVRAPQPSAAEPCPPGVTADPRKQNASDVGQLKKKAIKFIYDDQLLDAIAPHVGKCLLHQEPLGKGEKPRVIAGIPLVAFRPPDFPQGSVPFNQTVLNHWSSKKVIPKIEIPAPRTEDHPNQDTRPLAKDELLSIDALARTIYAEMAQCWENGPQYLAAVARITLNRAEIAQTEPDKSKWPFTAVPADAKGSAMTQVIATPRQYSLWNPDRSNRTSLSQGLCPSANPDAPFYMGHAPGKGEQKIWRACLQLATMAVLKPEEFKAETRDLEGVYHYTSNRGNPWGPTFKKVRPPSIYGMKAGNARCFEAWKKEKATR